jgi:hypothetical protein
MAGTFDYSQPWAGTLTQRHARLIGTENRRVESVRPWNDALGLGDRAIQGRWRGRLWLPQRRPAIFVNGVSATTGDRSHATHARSHHPNNPVRRHILAAKLPALRRQEQATALRRQKPATALRRQELAPRRQTVPYKPGLHRPVVPCTPVGALALRIHRQVPPNQRPVLRSRNPESNKPAPMRSPLKIPKRLLRERELYSSPIFLVLCRRP